jgi:hypothetical protein
VRRLAAAVAWGLVAMATTGCASWWRGAATGASLAPSGLPWGEELTRRALVLGAFDQALARTGPRGDGVPSDPLLAALFRGQVAYHAGQYEASVAAFAAADRLAEARGTASVSRGLGALLVSERALPYVPSRTERLFARHYALLARHEAGDVPGATVEARRLSALLEATAGDLEPAERALHAALRELAGAVFEAAGDLDDAGVAYRNAALLRGGAPDSLDSLVGAAPPADSATLVLVVEEGVAGHLVARSVALPLEAESRVVRRGGRAGTPRWPGDGRSQAADGTAHATALAADWLASLGRLPGGGVFEDAADWGGAVPDSASTADAGLAAAPSGAVSDAAPGLVPWRRDGPPAWARRNAGTDWLPRHGPDTRFLGPSRAGRDWLRVAWPLLVRGRLPDAPLAVRLSGAVAAPMDGALVSDALGADARRRLPGRLTRLATRVATRVVVREAMRDEYGAVAGFVAELVGAALDQPDTRAWHLLPGRLRVLRVTVPSGPVAADLQQGVGPNARAIPVPAFVAAPGSVTVRAVRVWRDPPAASPTLAGAPDGATRGPGGVARD